MWIIMHMWGNLQMIFKELFSRYYTYVFIIVILIYTIYFNRAMYRKVRGKFLALLALVLLGQYVRR